MPILELKTYILQCDFCDTFKTIKAYGELDLQTEIRKHAFSWKVGAEVFCPTCKTRVCSTGGQHA